VQCVVTSPPYWGLRDYGVDGQIGLEKTPEEYVAKMVEVFREVRRVLRDDGTVWLNLGDCYNGSGKAGSNPEYHVHHTEFGRPSVHKERFGNPTDIESLKPKDLVGIPWRVAFALQADGWYLRSDIIWSKPNPMPESVTDRPTKSHEYIFLLTKKARYYYDAEAVREKGTIPTGTHAAFTSEMASGNGIKYDRPDGWVYTGNRNRRTVWEIATQPFPMAHSATFPEALVEPCIKAGTSERGCCSVCGAPWVRVVEKERMGGKQDPNAENYKAANNKYKVNTERGFSGTKSNRAEILNRTVGWQPSCSCNADTVPCIVLDPFGGSGTVGKVARDLNRKAILIELNAEYIKIARERLRLNEQLGAFA
jgi:DNA modification methylase